jgi:hypothetical protein
MTILLEPYIIPEKGKVELKVERSFEIKVTAEEAQRQVNRWLLNEVSYLIGADPPTLVVGEQVVWRVPAWIGFPHTGRAGVVGMVDVDVTTGAMNNTPECKAEIERRAEELAARQPPYQSKSEVPEVFLPKHIPPAPKVTIAEDGQLQMVS